MKEQTQTAAARRTYEMHDDEWREVEPQSKARAGSVLRALGALAATVCAVLAIAVIGTVATAAALVLAPAALLALWSLGAFSAQGMERRRSQ